MFKVKKKSICTGSEKQALSFRINMVKSFLISFHNFKITYVLYIGI